MILRYLAIPCGLGLTLLILWLMWPSPIDPVRWDEPPAPGLSGPSAPDDDLAAATLYRVGEPGTAHSIAVSTDGMVYFGTVDGDIMRLRAAIAGDGIHPEHLAHITDEPVFGMAWIDESTLAIATAGNLHSLNLTSLEVRTLSTGSTSHAFGRLTNLAVAENGIIYLTDSSTRWDHGSRRPGYYYDMLENRPNGLVYAWDPRSREAVPIRDRLYYPNGIAIASDGQSLFVSESFRYMIQRIWIGGPRRGEIEVFAKNLPGMPAGLAMDDDGNLVVAMATRRSRLLATAHRNPLLTQILIKLPQWLRPTDSRPRGFVLRLRESDGQIRDAFHDPDSALNYLSSVTVGPGGVLWLGSAFGGIIGRFDPADLGDQPTQP
tara:strand:+ start:366 stop:1493 length:1128 start_codon:yes stop_codon:yes gene_type:complete